MPVLADLPGLEQDQEQAEHDMCRRRRGDRTETQHPRRRQRDHLVSPLGEGDLDGTVVVCPWHGWRWDVTSGANTNNPAVRVPCFPVSVQDGEIFVDLP